MQDSLDKKVNGTSTATNKLQKWYIQIIARFRMENEEQINDRQGKEIERRSIRFVIEGKALLNILQEIAFLN